MKFIPVVTDADELRQKSSDIEWGEEEDILKASVSALLVAYTKLGGACQGLAAPQVGFKKNVILIRDEFKSPKIIVNAHILKMIGSKKSNEGCISEGDLRYIVQRPLLAKVEYYDYDTRKEIVKWLIFPLTRVYCHEIDHINGILLQDKGVRA